MARQMPVTIVWFSYLSEQWCCCDIVEICMRDKFCISKFATSEHADIIVRCSLCTTHEIGTEFREIEMESCVQSIPNQD